LGRFGGFDHWWLGGGALLLAFVGALLLTPVAARLAWRSGLIARPSARGIHSTPTPLLGGLGVAAGFFSAFGAATILRHSELWIHDAAGLLVSGALMLIVGYIDDRRALGWQSKLSLQALAASLFVAVALTNGPADLTAVLLCAWILVGTNAVNYIDNTDGLCAPVSAWSAMALAAVAFSSGMYWLGCILSALFGACAGFLVHNWPPAKVFLGDTGSLLIGFILAASAALLWRSGALDIVGIALAFAYPLFDLTFVSLNRVWRGVSPFRGGTDHSSHRLARWVGSGSTATTALVTGAALGPASLLVATLTANETLPLSSAVLLGCAGVVFGCGLIRRDSTSSQSAERAARAP
jgi:UDP-GlcNAc:undecaprenyl-phosphate/decaprenyl-phosphate GlcNAc-1-phosphate transferase